MNGYFKAGLCVAAAAGLMFGGFTVERWRAERDKAELAKVIAQAETRGAQANLAKLAAANVRADKLQANLGELETTLDTLTREKNDAIRRLTVGRRCLDSAAVRVLNQRPQPGIVARAVPQAAGEPLSDDAAFATDTDVGIWIASCQRGYDTCRGRLQAIADFYGETE